MYVASDDKGKATQRQTPQSPGDMRLLYLLLRLPPSIHSGMRPQSGEDGVVMVPEWSALRSKLSETRAVRECELED